MDLNIFENPNKFGKSKTEQSYDLDRIDEFDVEKNITNNQKTENSRASLKNVAFAEDEEFEANKEKTPSMYLFGNGPESRLSIWSQAEMHKRWNVSFSIIFNCK